MKEKGKQNEFTKYFNRIGVCRSVAVQVSFHSVFWFFVDILPTEVNVVLSQPVKLDAAK
jgi:hypothetical protein